MDLTPEMSPDIGMLYREMKKAIEESRTSQSGDSLGELQVGIEITRNALEKLRAYVSENPFDKEEHEIQFFKHIKPEFQSHFIYYCKAYKIEINKSPLSKDIQLAYYRSELYKLKKFFDQNREFYCYYRSGATFLDPRYFVRNGRQLESWWNSHNLSIDTDFSSGYDYLVGRIIASELLCNYITRKIGFTQEPEISRSGKTVGITWTGQKVALAELIYAFHASGVFNNSQVDIKKMTDFFSDTFKTPLGNIYKTFEEIRLRKKNRTSFLDSLRQNLLRQMDQDDQQSF